MWRPCWIPGMQYTTYTILYMLLFLLLYTASCINTVLDKYKEYRIQGGGDRFSVHFAVTFLDRWRTSFCVTTIIKIVNNNTKNKQTSGISGVRCN